MSPALFDPGLRPERTALAWRRTALAVMIGSLLGGRLLAPVLSQIAVIEATVGFVLGAALFAASGRRARAVDAALLERRSLHRGPGAGLLAVTAAGCALAGLAGAVLVVSSAPG